MSNIDSSIGTSGTDTSTNNKRRRTGDQPEVGSGDSVSEPQAASVDAVLGNINEADASLFKQLLDHHSIYSFKRSTPWNAGGPPETPIYLAAQYAPSQQVIEPTSTGMVPEKFSLEKASLFPELYLNFLMSFGQRSTVHYDYCNRTAEGFRGCFRGSSDDIEAVVFQMNKEFNTAFRENVDPDDCDLLNIVPQMLLSRYGVENDLYPKFLEYANLGHYFLRENELSLKAIGGDVVPLILALKSGLMSDHDIWMRLCPLLIRQCKDPKAMDDFMKLLKKHKAKTGEISARVSAFVRDLVTQKLFVKKSGGGNVSNHVVPSNARHEKDIGRKSNKPNHRAYKSLGGGDKLSKGSKTNGPRLRADGTPWIPAKEFYKRKVAEQQKQKPKPAPADASDGGSESE